MLEQEVLMLLRNSPFPPMADLELVNLHGLLQKDSKQLSGLQRRLAALRHVVRAKQAQNYALWSLNQVSTPAEERLELQWQDMFLSASIALVEEVSKVHTFQRADRWDFTDRLLTNVCNRMIREGCYHLFQEEETKLKREMQREHAESLPVQPC